MAWVFFFGAMAGFMVGVLVGHIVTAVTTKPERKMFSGEASKCPHLNGSLQASQYFNNPVVRELDEQEKTKNIF